MNFINIILTLISSAGAVTCAIFAYKSLTLSHTPTLLLTNTNTNNGDLVFELTNYGPGIAHNVSIEYTRSIVGGNFEQEKIPQNNIVLKPLDTKKISTPLNGIMLQNELIIRWKSISGKKYESRIHNSSIYNDDVS